MSKAEARKQILVIAEREKLASVQNAVTIQPVNMKQGAVRIVFESPYVSNAFSEETKKGMEKKQAEGATARTSKQVRQPKNFSALYEQSKHVSVEGWCGIPAGGFLGAIMGACPQIDVHMTTAKKSIRIVPDGYDRVDGMGLVKITKGEPREVHHAMPNANGMPDLRSRAMWDTCEATLTVKWDADQFTATDIANLLNRAGQQVGVGAGRPGSKKSPGCGWGIFKIAGIVS